MKIAIVRLDHLGDNILGLPLITSLRNKYTSSVIDVFVESDSSDLYSMTNCVESIIGIDVKRVMQQDHAYIEKMSMRGTVKQYDILINPRYAEDNYFTFKLVDKIDSKRKLSFRQRAVKVGNQIPNYYYSELIDQRNNQLHVSEYNRIICEYLTIPYIGLTCIKPELINSEQVVFNEFIKGSRYIVISISVRQKSKNWGVNNFSELVDLILEDSHYDIVLTGSKADHGLAKSIASKSRRVLNICGVTKITDFAYVIQNALAYIGADSGGMHLAADLNTPIIQICHVPSWRKSTADSDSFGGYCWYPNSSKIINCYPIMISDSDIINGNSIKSIKPKVVFNALQKLMNKFPIKYSK